MSNFWSDGRKVAALTGAVAFAVGSGVGYFFGNRHIKVVTVVEKAVETDLDVSAINDIREDRELVDVAIAEQAHPSMKPVKEEVVIELVQTPQEEVAVVTAQTTFASDDDGWNYEEEVKKRERHQGVPYIIHRDEFFAEEMDFTQATLTYYAGDGILVDEDDKPIYNHENIVGRLEFGHGSGGDPNAVYIRNEHRRMEYEIVRHSGMYSTDVLGLHIEDDEVTEIQHSRQPKFRRE